MDEKSLPRHILTTQLVIWDKEHDRVLKEIAEIRATYGSHQSMSTDDRNRLVGLLARRKELRVLLSIKY